MTNMAKAPGVLSNNRLRYHGLAARTVLCRYLRSSGRQCTEKAIDPDAAVVLCAKHLGEAMHLFNQSVANWRKTPPTPGRNPA